MNAHSAMAMLLKHPRELFVTVEFPKIGLSHTRTSKPLFVVLTHWKMNKCFCHIFQRPFCASAVPSSF